MTVTKLQAAAHELQLSRFPVYPVVVRLSIGAGMRQQHDKNTKRRCFVALPCPLAHRLAVGWIAEDVMGAPALGEAVVFLRIEPQALCIAACRARVQREIEIPS